MAKEIDSGVLLDITTLVTLASDICSDLKNIIGIYGDLDGWKWVSDDTRRQLKDEMENPVYTKIMDKIKNEKWYVCRAAFEKWKDMLNKSGSRTEKERVKKIINNF